VSDQTKSFLKLAAAVMCLVLGGGLLFSRLRDASRVGEEGAQVWYYDESEKEIYPVARDTIPPHKGIGGPKGDGVRAVVAVPKGDAKSPSKRRVAYLETYRPELKKLLEDVRATRVARRAFPVPVPSRDSDYFGTNTVVRRPGEPDWHAVSSKEGQRIMSEWRTWQGPDGQPLVLCLPE
jgi:hypothetical protein